MNWDEVIDRIMDSGKDHPQAMLFFLVKRLKEHPDAYQAIPDSVRDLANWYTDQADALDAEYLRRYGGEIVEFPSGSGK